MHNGKKIGLLGILWAVSTSLWAALPVPVIDALAQSQLSHTNIGVWVQSVDSDTPFFSHNPQRSMNPASLMKIVTTSSALGILGPDYAWKTQIYTAQQPNTNGVLFGDVYIKGYGDPRLSLENFWLLLRQLREQGVKEIRGDLVLDKTYFSQPPQDFKDDEDSTAVYKVSPDALLTNLKTVRFKLRSDDTLIQITPEPNLAELQVVNQLKLASNGDCATWKNGVNATTEESAGKLRIIFTGNYPSQCAGKAYNMALFDHARYSVALFKLLWAELGGNWAGTTKLGAVPAEGAYLMATHYSPPLVDVVRDVNKYSNNTMAQQIFLTIGAEKKVTGNNAKDAESAIKNYVKTLGVDAPELVLENGAGLSRIEKITPQNMGLLLRAVDKTALGSEFTASLPIVGIDGTMAKHLVDSPVRGQAHLKSGTLNDAKALAGFVHTKQGKKVVVVAMINQQGAGNTGMPVLLELIKFVYENY